MEIIKLGNATGVLKQEDSISIQVPAANNAVRALHVHSADWMKLIEFFNGLSIMGEVVKAFCGPAGGGRGGKRCRNHIQANVEEQFSFEQRSHIRR